MSEWIEGTVTLFVDGTEWPVDAWIYEQLCVHRMVDTEGWAISLVATGWRLTSRDRVLASRDDARFIVEVCYPTFPEWSDFFRVAKNHPAVKKFNQLHDDLEDQGGVLDIRVVAARI